MVKQHYRWDFIGLSTDTKPTPETSEKVVDGSTFYCSDTSKLYVYCKNNWYEKVVEGGGGGTSDFDELSNRPKYNGTAMTGETNIPEVPNVNQIIGKAKELTSADYDYPDANPTGVALWRLESGVYKIPANTYAYCYQWFNTPNAVDTNSIVIVSPERNGSVRIVEISAGRTSPRTCKTQTSDGQRMNELTFFYPIINDTLTSFSSQVPLSANQGRVLKYYIDSISQSGSGAPTTSTTGTVGQLYQDTTNGKLYICTAIVPGTDPDPDTYTWEEVGAGGSITPVQTTGTSTTDVMSQNAVTSMVYADPETKEKIQIGTNASADNYRSLTIGVGAYAGWNDIAIGSGSQARYQNAIAIGTSSYTATTASASIAIGSNAKVNGAFDHSVALGAYSNVSRSGEVAIGTGQNNYGYGGTPYRLLTGVYDPQSAHDAATKGYCDNATINGGTTAPTTTTVGAVGTQYTYVDTTGTPTAHLCVCTAIDTTDPDNPVYTWQTLI